MGTLAMGTMGTVDGNGMEECLDQRCWLVLIHQGFEGIAKGLSQSIGNKDRTVEPHLMDLKAWRFTAQPTLLAKTSSSTMTPGLEDTSARHLKP